MRLSEVYYPRDAYAGLEVTCHVRPHFAIFEAGRKLEEYLMGAKNDDPLLLLTGQFKERLEAVLRLYSAWKTNNPVGPAGIAFLEGSAPPVPEDEDASETTTARRYRPRRQRTPDSPTRRRVPGGGKESRETGAAKDDDGDVKWTETEHTRIGDPILIPPDKKRFWGPVEVHKWAQDVEVSVRDTYRECI
jgi:hypothetical protein